MSDKDEEIPEPDYFSPYSLGPVPTPEVLASKGNDWEGFPKKEQDPTFEITLEEAYSLIKLLDHEYIPREPPELYEHIMRLMNGLSNFVAKYEKDDK